MRFARSRRSPVFVAVVAIGLLDALAGGAVLASRDGNGRREQTPSAQSGAAVAAEVQQAIDSARTARGEGRSAEAVSTIAAVLKKYPSNSDAARFQIETFLTLTQFDQALKTYDAYVTARNRPDPVALGTIGKADLQQIARSKKDRPLLMTQALDRLARDGDAQALRALKQISASSSITSPEGLAAAVSLARLKDADGTAKLTDALNLPQSDDRNKVLQAISDAGLRSLAPKIIPLLSTPEPEVRGAAAVTLGALQAKEALPALESAFANDVPAVKMFAAVGLKRLGSSSADTFLNGLLNGQIAELRVIAAGAYQFSPTKNAQWQKAVRELMSGPDERHRLQAAEMLACCDVAAARQVLTSAVASANPLLRAGAAQILETKPELADAALARRIMGDPIESVRVYGDGLALGLAKTAAAGTPARGRGAAVNTNR